MPIKFLVFSYGVLRNVPIIILDEAYVLFHLNSNGFFKKSFVFILCVCVSASTYACVPHAHQVPLEAIRRRWIPWKLEL